VLVRIAGAGVCATDLQAISGADLVLDFAGSDQTHGDGMAMLGRLRTYSVVGFGGTLSVPSAAMVGTERAAVANLVGSWRTSGRCSSCRRAVR
jgi:D-arabinose 1-dehydrogenase-like Zn-dependent alcohol dehydrogenase